MSSALIDRLGGSAISLAVELFILWKIWQALKSGTVTLNFSNSNTPNPNNSLFDFSAGRADSPTLFWLMTGFLMFSAVFVGCCFIFIAAGGVH
jgi:hypothetical protein